MQTWQGRAQSQCRCGRGEPSHSGAEEFGLWRNVPGVARASNGSGSVLGRAGRPYAMKISVCGAERATIVLSSAPHAPGLSRAYLHYRWPYCDSPYPIMCAPPRSALRPPPPTRSGRLSRMHLCCVFGAHAYAVDSAGGSTYRCGGEGRGAKSPVGEAAKAYKTSLATMTSAALPRPSELSLPSPHSRTWT